MYTSNYVESKRHRHRYGFDYPSDILTFYSGDKKVYSTIVDIYTESMYTTISVIFMEL